MFIIILILIIGVALFYYSKNKLIGNPKNWYQHFNFQFSTQEFYQRVQNEIKRREMPDVRFDRITYSQGGIFSARREYLRVQRNEYVFDICGAPFGTGFFVSSWFAEKAAGMLSFSKIPVLNSLFGKNRDSKTYYQVDTETMFRCAVHGAILAVIDEINTVKGVRGISELDLAVK